MYTKMHFLKKMIRSLSWRIFNYLENNGNARFETNGEKTFLVNLFKNFRKEKEKVRVILDIGANIGEYSGLLLQLSNLMSIPVELHLFEPTRSCFDILSKKFALNKNVFLNNFGISNSNTIAMIFYDQEKSGLASLYKRELDHYDIQLHQSEEVTLKRMDEYFKDKGINHVDFVKIDIEGHELYALEGFGDYLNCEFIDFIQFEYGGANLDSCTSLLKIYKFLKSRGFVIAKIMRKGLEIREYAPFMENFQYQNYVAISRRVLDK